MKRTTTTREVFALWPSDGGPTLTILGNDHYELQSYKVVFERTVDPTSLEPDEHYYESVEIHPEGHRLTKARVRDPRSRGWERVYGGILHVEGDKDTPDARTWVEVAKAHNAHYRADRDVDNARMLYERSERLGFPNGDTEAQELHRAKRERDLTLHELRQTVQRVAAVGI